MHKMINMYGTHLKLYEMSKDSFVPNELHNIRETYS